MDNATSPRGDGACVRRSRALPFTEAAITRIVRAARKAGLRVTAVRVGPDGTIETMEAAVTPLDEPEREIVL